MQNTDATYKSIYESGDFYTETRVTIGKANHIVTEEDLVSVKSRKRVFNGDNPEVGCCVCGELFLQMYSPQYDIIINYVYSLDQLKELPPLRLNDLVDMD